MRRIDIVVPLYNEASCLPAFYGELCVALDALPYVFRIILVDDGSTDRTGALCRRLAAVDSRVRYLRLSRNFGHQAALTAGFDLADADAVLTMDSDLQHPPETIAALIAAWEGGAEVVHAQRSTPQDGFSKDLTSKLFYRLLSRIVSIPLVVDSPDYKLLDRRALLAIRRFRERGRFLRGLSAWIGFKQASVAYPEGGRYAGRSKYSVARMFAFASAAVLGFSRAPLRAATWLGGLVCSGAVIFGLYLVSRVVLSGTGASGWQVLAVLVSFLSGVQLLTLGVLGEYLGQVLDEVKQRPLYLVAEDSADRVGTARSSEQSSLRPNDTWEAR